MEQITLQIGKTYRSRNGKDVRIIAQVFSGEPRYQGDNGHRYTESGRLENYNMETIHDLIEEAPKFSRTFDIPNGVKKVTVSQKGNRIIVEMVPEKVEPKPGDVMVGQDGSVYIFKSVVGDIHKHFAWLVKDGRLSTGTWCNPGRPATIEQAQPLFDALKKAGKRWNAEKLQIEEIPEIERILEWVEVNIKEGYYNHEDVAEAIENYLKYREGKEKEKDRPNP